MLPIDARTISSCGAPSNQTRLKHATFLKNVEDVAECSTNIPERLLIDVGDGCASVPRRCTKTLNAHRGDHVAFCPAPTRAFAPSRGHGGRRHENMPWRWRVWRGHAHGNDVHQTLSRGHSPVHHDDRPHLGHFPRPDLVLGRKLADEDRAWPDAGSKLHPASLESGRLAFSPLCSRRPVGFRLAGTPDFAYSVRGA